MENDLKPYQDRMKGFILVGSLYSIGVAVYTVFYGEPSPSWLIVATTITLLIAMAIGFDAVFDSIRERLPSSPATKLNELGA